MVFENETIPLLNAVSPSFKVKNEMKTPPYTGCQKSSPKPNDNDPPERCPEFKLSACLFHKTPSADVVGRLRLFHKPGLLLKTSSALSPRPDCNSEEHAGARRQSANSGHRKGLTRFFDASEINCGNPCPNHAGWMCGHMPPSLPVLQQLRGDAD
jgi:hypothetical protein